MSKFTLDDLEAAVPEKMAAPESIVPDVTWSPFQEAIFDAVSSTSDNLSVEAVAGSGKTTTILEAMRRLPTSNVLFLAFNKSIQLELADRVPMGVNTATFNALGHRILRRKTNANRIDQYKSLNILREMLTPDAYKEYGWDLARVMSAACHEGLGIRTALDYSTWENFLVNGRVTFEPDDLPKLAEVARLAFDRRLETTADCFDFDDQLYMPLFYGMTFPQYDVVFVDEAQDLSPIQHMQLAELAKRGARIIAVGDSYQAIYAFRGADIESMQRLRDRFDAQLLPLSICYRCDQSIVERAQRLVPHIQWREGAPEGTITQHEEMPHPADFEQQSMVMCRNNAPLMNLALHFLIERVPCYIVMDFAQDLTRLIDKMKATTTQELEQKLIKWHKEEVARAERLGRDHLINLLDDKLESLLPFCKEYKFAVQVKEAIQQLMRSNTGPRLSTIHKAKGLEANHAYILRPDLLPSKHAQYMANEFGDYSEMQQEKNLEYVAITRAQHHLHILPYEEAL